MRYVKRARHVLAVLLFAIIGAPLGGINVYWGLLMATLRRESQLQKAARVERWQERWGYLWFWLHYRVGGMRIIFQFDESFLTAMAHKSKRYIAMGNHYGSFDVLLMARLLKMLGKADYRPIAKHSISKIPVLGTAWKMAGSGFMKRTGKGSGDTDVVTITGKMVFALRTNALIYPEGTVVTKETATQGNRTLLPPKYGGHNRLRRQLPGYDTLTNTMYFRDFDPWWMSDEGIVPPGSDLIVEVRVLPAPKPDASDEELKQLLDKEWAFKKQWLDTVQ